MQENLEAGRRAFRGEEYRRQDIPLYDPESGETLLAGVLYRTPEGGYLWEDDGKILSEPTHQCCQE